MQELDDLTLLRKYANEASEEAFAALVTRHINKVYSVALRHTGNPDSAEEITQAVFVILARKSGALASGWKQRLAAAVSWSGNRGATTSLSGWLYQTARLTATTFIRSAIRRTRREQEACMQSVLTKTEPEVWAQIAPLLDAAMAALNETDRHAVVLRFFDGKSMGEIGAALGASEDAVKKRVGRALEKLQHYFAKRGIDSTTDTIAQAITTNSVQTAPALLVESVTAIALAKGAAASISTLTLAKATLIAMKTKAIVTTVTATVILAGITTWLAGLHFGGQPKKAAPDFAAAGVTFPIQLPNDTFRGGNNPDPLFAFDTDPDMRRTSNSAPAIHVKGPLPPPPGLPANFSDAAQQKSGNGNLAPYVITNGSPLLGRHVRITGWLKCHDVKNWAAAYLAIYNVANNQFPRVDSMDDRDDRPILKGTMDWQQIEFVTDIPKDPCIIYVGPDLYGPGELWGDDFQIALAPADTPITDDRHWRHTTAEPNTYSQTTDFQTRHNGHATICLAYTGTGAAPSGSWEWWGQKLRDTDVDKYAGHTIEWTGWVKLENVSNRLQPTIRPWIFDPLTTKSSINAKDKLANGNTLKGTSDWTQFTVTCAISDDVNHIDTALIFYGSGKVWVDMESLKFRVIR